ncbi:hypothetical protein DV711_08225 [Motiliproteus coralliicola]|uniref:Uncharacterized protein n=1 Tax=Motiliproteus coralliicola TaxID=2283196 RepID=A0A369WKI5_9GAMM|nr:hypothetical protein [Motiliproteus coralliicola]RDE22568.1 hypothetical protein DV711_08225 [Motiliproteus coralliicola]
MLFDALGDGCVIVCVGDLMLLDGWVLEFLSKPGYLEYLPIFWWLLVVHVFLVISYFPHYGLYALKSRTLVFLDYVITLAVFLLVLWLLDLNTGLMQVAMALVLAFSTSLLVKQVGFIRPYGLFFETGHIF